MFIDFKTCPLCNTYEQIGTVSFAANVEVWTQNVSSHSLSWQHVFPKKQIQNFNFVILYLNTFFLNTVISLTIAYYVINFTFLEHLNTFFFLHKNKFDNGKLRNHGKLRNQSYLTEYNFKNYIKLCGDRLGFFAD